MLQTRLDNEQFNALGSSLNSSRLQNGFITTDRPDSSQLVDLHIYLVPKSVWKNVQHLAQNEAMHEAASAGFVRVSPDMKLQQLREPIERLCRTEAHFPREYIFLRSVGRCLTRVKQTQENELKVKNYRPPQTFAPEIYVLEGRHEDYANISSASPTLSSASYLFGNRHPTRSKPTGHHPSLRLEKNRLSKMNTHDLISRIPLSGRKSWTRFTQVSSELDLSSPNKKSISSSSLSVATNGAMRDLSKVKEEQERLRHRQAELERIRRAAAEKEGQRRVKEKTQSVREENERQRQRKEKTQLEREEKAQSKREEDDRRRQRRRQEKAESERRRLEQEEEELAATKIQATFRAFKERQVFRERQKNIIERNTRKDEDDDLSDGSILSRSSSIGSTSDVDSTGSRPETRTINRESIHSNLTSYSKKTDRTSHSSTKPTIEETDIRAATVTKMRRPEEGDVLLVSTPDLKDIEESYEIERREGEEKRRRQTADDRRKAKELEDQRRRDQRNRRLYGDGESLRMRLQELHTSRVDLEKIRDEVTKQIEHLHARIALRRKEARDMWKKKYFLEKKKTPPAEEQSNTLKTDLEQLRQKIVQTMDNECKHIGQMGYTKEAELGNMSLQIIRFRYESEDLHHQIEQAKLRLTTDVKLRNQAEIECRTLKHELGQAKMNLNHMKNRL